MYCFLILSVPYHLLAESKLTLSPKGVFSFHVLT